MIKYNSYALIALTAIVFSMNCTSVLGQEFNYPKSKQVHQLDQYHGVKITDPYRWLESVDSEETQSWMMAQDQTLKNYINDEETLSLINNSMDRLNKTGDNYSVPIKGGQFYFYTVSKPELQHNLIYYKEGLNGQAHLLLDMNKELEEEETFGGFSICPNGHFMVIRIRKGQDRYGKLKIFNVDNKTWYNESLDGTTSANVGWTYNNGFYYIYYGPSASLNEQSTVPHSTIKYHKIKTPQSDDQIVLEASKKKDEPLTIFSIRSSHNFRHLIVKTTQGRSDRNKVHLVETINHKIYPLVESADHPFNYVGSKEDNFFFYTNIDAPNGKVISINKNKPQSSNWELMIPEQKDVLAGGSTVGGNAMNFISDKFTLLYREGTQTVVRIFNLDGKLLHTVPLETGWIGSGLVGTANGNEAWFSLNSFCSPNNVYRMNLNTGKYEVFFDRGLPIKREDYIIRNTYYESFDGTRVPIYICHKKDLKPDGSNPVFMYGYGFGGWVATPWYQPQMLTFIEMGGIYVLPGIRGGGEFGDEWRDAGIMLNRQNAISDFITAAEFLIDENYTSGGKVVANGWSASGSLAAAATMQRPDLFGAAMIGIPSLDMIRYEQFTAFKGWTAGYGSPDKQDEFLNLYRWSPYHNIKSNTCYPPMLVTVGEKDPTTPPQHGYKFIAALQSKSQFCNNPALLKIVWGGGHGFGMNNEQTMETKTQELAFLIKALDMNVGRLRTPE